ncbi:MAG: SsrA-binding protein SsrA-binding protein [Parcubacteria group bacterium]|nr:SsrA-binding protein SsrA-binding protein [Parcubacteria group bacterium]
MTTYAKNQKAHFDYEILETIPAGLELTGQEVKSVREGKVSLQGSHVSVRGGEAFLLGSDIQAYQPKNAPADYDSIRARKLLLSKQELENLLKAEGTKGLTIVPISVYNKGRFVKLDIAIVRGKKKFDKRQALKKRDTERDLERKL